MITSTGTIRIAPSIREFILFFTLSLFLFLQATAADAFHFSEHHSLNFDSQSKEEIGDKVFEEISRFFHEAELAIETKNLEALMDLYSDNY